jgi:hypothetical protein
MPKPKSNSITLRGTAANDFVNALMGQQKAAPKPKPKREHDPAITDSERIEKLSKVLQDRGGFIYGNGNPGKGKDRSPDAIRAWIDHL